MSINKSQLETWRLLESNFQADAHYRSDLRHEVVRLIRRPPTFVIDLGCGTGVTGALIKEKYPAATVIGIEAHQPSAEIARSRLDRVLAGRFEDIDLAKEGIEPHSVDLFVAADVLEHLYNPWGALMSLHTILNPDAAILASVPNVRNLALLENLMDRGRWRYGPDGLLDVTHVRFFTKREIFAMFTETGYRIRHFAYKLDPVLSELYHSMRGNHPVTIRRGRFVIENLTQEEWKEFCSLQILIVAEPVGMPF